MLSLLYEQALHLARPLGPWLANYLIHSTVLAGLAWLAATRLRSPAVREMVWRCALFGPLLTTSAQALLGESLPGKRIAVGSAAEPAAGEAGAGAVALAVPTGSPAAPAARRSTPAPGRAQAADGAAPALDPWGLLGLAWMACAALALARLGRRRLQLARALAPRRRVQDAELQQRFRALARELAVGRARLTASPALASPIALGVLGRREVCLPEQGVRELPAEEQRGLFAHELAHLARRDPLWLLAGHLVASCFPLQPLNRLVRRRLQAEAELLADERAARGTGSPLSLARCLARVAGWVEERRQPALAPAMARSDSALVERVRRLLEGASAEPTRRARLGLALGLGASLVLFACAAPRVSEGERPEAGEPERARIVAVIDEREVDARVHLSPEGEAVLERPAAGAPPQSFDLTRQAGVLELRAALAAVAAAMEREPDDGSGLPPLPAGRLRIVVAEGTPYRHVKKVLEQCGTKDVLIWNVDLAGAADGMELDDVYPVPLPRDVGVTAGVGHPRVEVRIEVQSTADGQRSVHYRMAAGRVEQLASADLGALRSGLDELHAAGHERPLQIDARPGVLYGDVVAVLDEVIAAGFTDVVFVGAYD